MIFTAHTLVGVVLGDRYSLHVFDIVTLLHTLVGSIAIYALGFSFRVPRVWLVTSALVFMVGSVATSRLQHVSQIISYGWLPVLILMLVTMSRRPTPTRAVALAILGAFWAMNANQVVFLGALLLVVVAIYSYRWTPFPKQLLLSQVIALSLASLIVLPLYASMLETIGASSRAGISVGMSTWSSLPLLVYASTFMPSLYGNLHSTVWSPNDITENYLYIGLLPPILLLVAVIAGVRWWRPAIVAWIAMLCFFVAYSVGVESPVYRFCYNHLPGFQLFRRPSDAAYLVNLLFALGLLILGKSIADRCILIERKTVWRSMMVFVIVLLSLPVLGINLGAAATPRGGMGILFDSYEGLVGRVLILFGLFGVFFRLLKRTHRFVWMVIASLGIFLTLDISIAGRFGGKFTGTYSAHEIAPGYLARDKTDERLVDAWLAEHSAPWSRVEVVGGVKALGHSSVEKWFGTQGYNPLHLENYRSTIGAFNTMAEPRRFAAAPDEVFDARYDLLGLEYVAFYAPILSEKVDNGIAKQARAYRDALALEGGSMLKTDGHYEVWKRPGKSLWLATADPKKPGKLNPAPCKLIHFGNVQVDIACRMEKASQLIIGEVYAPGWTACVNGAAVELMRYSEVFRSVKAPAGPSRIRMSYRPVPFLRWKSCPA
ncbi:MAG TPA: hypothetical protein DDY14_10400 [Chromatiaceae bacterium]|nr:MAG: hypothetical protein N838_21205 [Thiohalocapsa sp. PB-PSB1]HBG95706.1 hypothetical protein [Chromatiaceae bacterium]HCS90944.1 hypothetical protein [Chromatiaceae bacterium]